MRAILRPLVLSASLLAAVNSGFASVITYTSNPVRNIPDSSSSGVVDTIHVTESGFVASMSLDLNLVIPAGEVGFAGDLYVYLQHGASQSVLLNRVGRSGTSSTGYDDNVPISVTFSDSAANGDIHNYRMTLNGSNLLPLSSTLSGTWQPDGRAVDPDTVKLSDVRSAALNVFNHANSSGDWSLFLADLSGGGLYALNGWSLKLDVTPIPEPESAAAVAGIFLLGVSIASKLRRKQL